MKILIIHTAFIGDIVLSTAMVSKLKDKYAESDIYYVTTPSGEAVLKNNPKIKEIIVYDKRGKNRGIKEFIKLIFYIRKLDIDICICPHRYMRSSILSFLSASKIKIGYDIADLSFLYHKKVKYDKTKHEVEKLLTFIDNEEKRYEVELYPDIKNKIKVEKFISEIKKDIKKIIVIAPGSKWFTKKWPEEYFKKLINNLLKIEGILVVVTGGEEEKKINLELSKEVLDLRGKITLLDLAELCRISNIVVSNDSAPIHISSAFPNTKILGIFGPTIKEFGFFPWSKNSKVFEVKNLSCRPCGIHGGNICPEKHFRCMKEILPEMIEDEIKKYLNI